MLSSRIVSKRRTFVVTPESLSRLVTALPAGKDELKFTMGCADGTTLYPAGIDELVGFPNPRTREIREIEISTSYRTETRWGIKFSSDILGPVTYNVSGEDSYVVSTADLIEQHLESMDGGVPHFISNSHVFQDLFGFFGTLAAAITTLAGLLLCLPILLVHKHFYIGPTMLSGFTSATIFVLGLMLLSIATKSERLLRYFFPRVSFCIGDGAVRYKRMTERRRHFGLGALVALAIGIFGRLLANLMLGQ
jgi:hypothetical protein